MRQQVIYSMMAMAVVPGAMQAANALTYAQFTAQVGWENVNFQSNIAAFSGNVMGYINDISDYQTPDKDTNVNLNTCKQTAEIDWTEVAKQTEANYNTYRLWEFVDGYTGPKTLEVMLANAKKEINGAEAEIWLAKAQTLLDNFKAGGAVYDKVAALQADGAELQYADVLGLEDNSKWEEAAKKAVSVKTLATELLAAFAADGGEQKAVQDFYDEINADKEATFNATEFETKIKGDGTGTLEKAVKLALDKATLLEGLQKWMVDAGVPSAEGLVKFEELVDEFDAALTTMPIVSERSAGVWRHAASRLRGQVYKVQVAVEKALAVYTDQLGEATPTWKNPKGFTVSVPKITIDGTDYGSKNYTISSMGASVLGSLDADPAAHYYALKDANYTIRHGIAFMKWFKINNEQAYEDAVEAVDKAKKKYNKEIQRLELAIQELDAKDPNTSANNDQYAELLEKAKTALLPYKDVLDTYYKEEEVDGNKVITGTIYETRKAGGDIGTQTTHNPQTFYLNEDASARVNNAGPARVPSEVWQYEITTQTTALGTNVDAWIAKAQAAYDRFKDLNTLVNGEANDGELKHDLAGTGFSAIPAALQEIAVYNDLKAQNDKIVADIQDLSDALTDANKTLNETGNDMAINGEGWDKTIAESKFWNKKEVTDPEFVTYAEIADEITALKAAVDAAMAEYNAWQKLLADADDLANRLQTASEDLTATTAAIQNPAYNPADYYGYKGIGDDAAQNTKMAKKITDYVAALKAKANEAYGDGNGAGAQTLLAEAPAYTDMTYMLSVPSVVFAPAGLNETNTNVNATALAAGKYKLGIKLESSAAGALGFYPTCTVVVKTGSGTFGNSDSYEKGGTTEGTILFELATDQDITVEIRNVDKYDDGQDVAFEFTLMKADGSTYGYQDTPLVDTDKDPDTDPDFTWKLADTDIKLLETGGAIATAVNNWRAFRTAVALDQEDMAAFFDQTVNGVKVNEHGIYTDDNHWYADNTEGNKYKTNEKAWQDYIEANGTNVIETNEALDAKDHFDAIGAVGPYALFNIDGQLAKDPSTNTAEEEIAKDMADYDQQAQLKLANDLNDQLKGADGYIEEAQDAWQDAYDAVYTNQADFWTKYDVDTKVWGDNIITGNADVLNKMWETIQTAITNIENARLAIEPDLVDPLKASDSWNALSALKKQLDQITNSPEAEGELTKDNCIAKLKEYTEHIMEGLKFNYETYKTLVNADPENPGKVDQLNAKIDEGKADVANYEFIVANGEKDTYQAKYDDMWTNFSNPVDGHIEDAYKNFKNFELVEYDADKKEWKATAYCADQGTLLDDANIRLNVLNAYVETYDEYLHVNTALNGDATAPIIPDEITNYAKKYGNPDGAITELTDPANEDKYGTTPAPVESVYKPMLTALNTASATAEAELTGEEVNLADLKRLLDHNRTAFNEVGFANAGALLTKIKATLTDKLGALTADEGNYSAFVDGKPKYAIQGVLELAKANMTAYNNILDAKQALSDEIIKDLTMLKDPAQYDQDLDVVKDLISLIETKYQPVPTLFAAPIVTCFEEGKAVPQDLDEKQYLPSGDFDYYPYKAVMNDSLTSLKKIVGSFTSSEYNDAIIAENNKIFSDEILTSYREAIAAYNNAMKDVEAFNAPKDEDLLTAYEAASKVLKDNIQPLFENVTTYKENALAHKNEANGDNNNDAVRYKNVVGEKGYTEDKAKIDGVKAAIETEFKMFLTYITSAMAYKWAALGYETKINTAWGKIEDLYLKTTTTKVSDIYDNSANLKSEVADGDPYGYFAAEWKAVNDAKACMDLKEKETDPEPARAFFGEFKLFDEKIAALANAETGIEATVAAGTHTAAVNDLQARLDDKLETVKANEGDKDVEFIDGKTTEATYLGQLYGTGNDAYKLEYYTYKKAVTENKAAGETERSFQDYVDMFEALKANTVEKAKTQITDNKTVQPEDAEYNDIKALIELYDDANDLKDAEDNLLKKWAGIKALLDAEYTTFLGNTTYLDNLADFQEYFKENRDGILSLIVGSEFAGDLENIAEELANVNKTTFATVKAEMEALVITAKVKEQNVVLADLKEMHTKYNVLLAANDPDALDPADYGTTEEYEAAKAEVQDKRDELIAQYASGTDLTGETDKGNMNIVYNEVSLKLYDENTPYADYLQIEHNLALIQQAIMGIAQDQLDEIATTLAGLASTLRDKTSAFIEGQKLFTPANAEFTDFKAEDFGLKVNYSDADYEALLKEVAETLEAPMVTIENEIAEHSQWKDAEKTVPGLNDIQLYEENIKKAITDLTAVAEALDLKYNGDDPATAYSTNSENIAKAEVAKTRKAELLAAIEDVRALLDPAKEKIENMGFTDENNETFNGTILTYGDWLDNSKDWVEAQYFALALLADTEVPSTGAGSAVPFKGGDAMAWGATNHSLGWFAGALNTLVKEYVDKKALALYADAKDAYDKAMTRVNEADVKSATRTALLANFATPEYDPETGELIKGKFNETLTTLDAQKGTRVYDEAADEDIFKYEAAVNKFLAELGFEINDEGELEETGEGFLDEVADEKLGDLDGGDGTGDGVVDVFDLTELINMVTNPASQPTDPKIFAAYDLNSDGLINVVDLDIELDIMGGKTATEMGLARAEKQFTETATAEVVSVEGNRQRIAISLNNWRQYYAFQMDVQLPKGMKLVGKELAGRATSQSIYGSEWAGNKNRVLAFTVGRDAFTGNDGAVLYLDVETTDEFRGGEIQYKDITFVTTDGVGIRFYIGDSETTGIMNRMANAANAAKQTIYNMGGRVMQTLKKGVNILRGENGETQKVIKK